MKKLTRIFTALSFAILFLTLNRMTQFTQGHLFPHEFLRWQDFNAMLTIPLVIITLYVFLFAHVIARKNTFDKKYYKYILIFSIGVYFYGASSGNHEVTNYLNHRFCIGNSGEFCSIVSYNDDMFSHILFYISTILMTSSLLLFEYFQPLSKNITKNEKLIISANALFIATGIVANLAFEKTGIDIIAFSILATISGYLFFKIKKNYRKYPIIYYATLSYTVGTFVTMVVKIATNI